MAIQKMCNVEIMKLIKELEFEKSNLIDFERRNSFVEYTNDEKDSADKTPYDIEATNTKIAQIDTNVRYLKHLLNVSNSNTVVAEFDITLGEALVYMSQLNNAISRLKPLINTDKITRKQSMYNRLQPEYQEAKYDINVAKEMFDTYKSILTRLQLAIDRTNLTNLIDVNFED